MAIKRNQKDKKKVFKKDQVEVSHGANNEGDHEYCLEERKYNE